MWAWRHDAARQNDFHLRQFLEGSRHVGSSSGVPGAPRIIFQTALGGVKCIANGDVDIFMCMAFRPRAVHDDFVAGYLDIDGSPIEFSLVLSVVRRVDDDVASDNLVIEMFELLDMRANAGFDSWRWIKIAESN